MNRVDFSNLIREKNFNKKEFLDLILNEDFYLDLSINLMINNKDIMIYYHCFEVLKEATKKEPNKFLKYKNDFINLLNHTNSYHRNFGIVLLSNITSGINEIDFFEFSSDYLKCLNDEKFMTAECCLENLNLLIKKRQEYTNYVIDEVLKTNNFQTYKEKQKAFIHGIIIELLITAYKNGFEKEKILEYIKDKKDSQSPKTKKLANKYIKILG